MKKKKNITEIHYHNGIKINRHIKLCSNSASLNFTKHENIFFPEILKLKSI